MTLNEAVVIAENSRDGVRTNQRNAAAPSNSSSAGTASYAKERGTRRSVGPTSCSSSPGAPAHAFEIEFAAKGTRRLRQILTGYRDTPRYGAVTWLVDTPTVAARLARLAAALGAQDRISVHAWIRLDAAERARVERAGAQATSRTKL